MDLAGGTTDRVPTGDAGPRTRSDPERELLRTGDLRGGGTRMLTVKTLGPSDPDEGYRHTRLFYRAMGFQPLQEFPDLWPGSPCLFMATSLT